MLKSGIEYVDHSWNPWIGCRKVSEGCCNCYMHREMARFGQDPSNIHRTSAATWLQVKKFEPGAVVFVCSWSDFFLQDADPWRDDAWRVIEDRPDVTWVIVTKRPESIPGRLPWGNGTPWPNVIGVVTAETQEMADRRVPLLLRANFAVRGASVEPMLGPVKLSHMDVEMAGDPEWFWINALTGKHTDMGRPCRPVPRLDWVVCGGESGPDARPMPPAAARALRDQCVEAGTPFYFKQWGEWVPHGWSEHAHGKPVHEWPDGTRSYRIGKKKAMPILDGKIWNQMPVVGMGAACLS